MALTVEQQLSILYRIIRTEKLDGERISQLTTEAPRKIGKFVATFGISYMEVQNLARPIIASIMYDLADHWGLLDALREDFVTEQMRKKLAEERH